MIKIITEFCLVRNIKSWGLKLMWQNKIDKALQCKLKVLNLIMIIVISVALNLGLLGATAKAVELQCARAIRVVRFRLQHVVL